MQDRSQYIVTSHAMDRYVLRTNKKFKHAQNCKFTACRKCDTLKRKARSLAIENKEEINETILQRLSLADSDRSYLNNSEFMMRYYKKYGYENRFEFLIHEDLLFVVVEAEEGKVVVTCILSKGHTVGKNHRAKIKFGNKKNVDLIYQTQTKIESLSFGKSPV